MIWRVFRRILIGLGILAVTFVGFAAWRIHHIARGRECLKLRPVMSTRIPPPFPRLSNVMGEEGTTILRVDIGQDGDVRTAAVEKSSGYLRLDNAATDYVKAHWKWQPPLDANCKPTAKQTHVAIVWHLRDAPSPALPHTP